MELGQMIFGNPTGNFGTQNYQDALVLSLLEEIERVFWNRYQEEWNRYDDPKLVGVEFRPYYWGDNEEEAAKPNLKFATSPQEIRWYKHPGRSMSVTIDWTPDEWVKWYEDAYQLILANDTSHF
jgi:hypothetical protein